MRGIIFISTFVLMSALESIWPRREALTSSVKERSKRWFHHLAFLSVGQLGLYLFLGFWGLSPLAVATYLQGEGILISLANWPQGARLVFEVLLLDFVIYWQHRLFHVLKPLWRLHRIHHSDPQLDASSALRFHPIEIILSGALKLSVVWVFGISVLGVFLFEVLLSSLALFNHANFYIPRPLEKFLSVWLITPDVHRVHHHSEGEGRFHNYGFNLTIWDKFFGTLMRVGEKEQVEATLGLKELPSNPLPNAWNLLTLGLSRKKNDV